MTNPQTLVGKTVTVIVERPLGSLDPANSRLVYPVNVGYAEGTVGKGGQPLEAYVLGIEEEMAEFTGKVAAIIHRTEDDVKLLVVTPEDIKLTEDDIIEATYFAEQYFESEIIR